MPNSSTSQSHVRSQRDSAARLSQDLKQALGPISSLEAWQELGDQVLRAQNEENPRDVQRILDSAGYQGDAENLFLLVNSIPAKEGIEAFYQQNPTFDLQKVPYSNPLLALQAVVETVMNR